MTCCKNREKLRAPDTNWYATAVPCPPLEMTKEETMKNTNHMPNLGFAMLAFACALTPTFAQQECDGYRYRYTGAFETHSITYDVPYGENLSWDGAETELVVDIYALQVTC